MRRIRLALTEDRERRDLGLRRSAWRRAHRALANRCHVTRQRGAPALVELTEAEWARPQPLLPPRRPRTGRPRHDHRTVLGGILWVVRSRASWRGLPTRFGKRERVL